MRFGQAVTMLLSTVSSLSAANSAALATPHTSSTGADGGRLAATTSRQARSPRWAARAYAHRAPWEWPKRRMGRPRREGSSSISETSDVRYSDKLAGGGTRSVGGSTTMWSVRPAAFTAADQDLSCDRPCSGVIPPENQETTTGGPDTLGCTPPRPAAMGSTSPPDSK
jgi:hypothetical protein